MRKEGVEMKKLADISAFERLGAVSNAKSDVSVFNGELTEDIWANLLKEIPQWQKEEDEYAEALDDDIDTDDNRFWPETRLGYLIGKVAGNIIVNKWTVENWPYRSLYDATHNEIADVMSKLEKSDVIPTYSFMHPAIIGIFADKGAMDVISEKRRAVDPNLKTGHPLDLK